MDCVAPWASLACRVQGTMYIVMNFFVFVCSACAGIHREMTHKVKGISMCVFNEQELKDITENGNAVSCAQVLPNWLPFGLPACF